MSSLYLIITLAGQRLAIPAADVESVVELDALVPVPRAPAHVAGLSALRSRVLTVIDSYASLELCRPDEIRPREAIIIEAEGYPYALLVDTVEDVVEVISEPRPAPTTLTGRWHRISNGVIEFEGELLLLVDSRALLAGPAAQAA